MKSKVRPFVCKKCHKTFTTFNVIGSIGTCPNCGTVNVSYMGMAEDALNVASKIIQKTMKK